MESFVDLLRAWNKASSERAKLQHIYLVIIMLGVVLSGLTALINTDLGYLLIKVAGVAVIAFLANALVWAIAQTYLFSRLSSGKRRAAKK